MPESVAAIWKTATYALAATVVTLAGTIVAMAKWFAKERKEIAEGYKGLMLDLNHNLDRIGDYLKEIYNREADTKKERTEFDFKLNDRK